jgi:hypothetical protein
MISAEWSVAIAAVIILLLLIVYDSEIVIVGVLSGAVAGLIVSVLRHTNIETTRM